MRPAFLVCFTFLALFGVPGECQDSPPKVASADQEDGVVVFEEDSDIDVGGLLSSLLANLKGKGVETTKEQNDNDTSVESSVPTNKNDVAKRNQLVDTFLSRLSETMRQSHDPLKIVFKKSGKINVRQQGKNKKKRRKWRRRFRKKANKWKKNGGGRNPKALTVVEGKEGEEETKKAPKEGDLSSEDYDNDYDDEEEGYVGFGIDDSYFEEEEDSIEDGADIEEEGNLVNGSVGGSKMTDTANKDNSSDIESPREGKQLGEVPEGGKSAPAEGNAGPGVGRARRKRRRRKGGRGKCGKACRRRRRNRRRRKNQKKRKAAAAGKSPRVMRTGVKTTALVSGMSVLRRSGNVRIDEDDEKENITADIEVGPIVLQAKRVFQSGNPKVVRTAEARTSTVTGELMLTLTPNGVALTKLDLIRPKVIEVIGNLARRPGSPSGRLL